MSKTTVIHVRDMDRDDPNDIYIGRVMPSRGLTDSKWANPFKIKRGTSRSQSIERFERLIRDVISVDPVTFNIEELRGKRLACWCHPLPCHGDVLVKLLAEKDALEPTS